MSEELDINEYSLRLVKKTEDGEETASIPFREAADIIARIAASMVITNLNK